MREKNERGRGSKLWSGSWRYQGRGGHGDRRGRGVPDPYTKSRPSSLQRHTMRQWSVPLCYSYLATACPRRPGPEVHMADVFNTNMGEVCDEYTCYACDSDENARSVFCPLIGGYFVIFV